MHYTVTYLTVHGLYEEQFRTKPEAKKYVKQLKEVIKLPGHTAAGIKIVKIA